MRTQAIWVSLLIIMLINGCIASSQPAPVVTDAGQPGDGVATATTQAKASGQSTLTVFAAASLTGVFQEIGQNFELANPGVQVYFNFAGSQILRTQLEQGAPADLFASADQQNMQLLLEEHLVAAEAIQDFASNSLVVILPPGNLANVLKLADLARPGLKLVLADGSVPAGNYARQVLEKMSQDPAYGADFGNKVLANVVSDETDVKQVVAKVELGEADAGIVYVSDAVASPTLVTLTIPAEFNVVATYPIAVLSAAREAEQGRAFIRYLTSSTGQAILAKWGFSPVTH